MRNPHLQPYVAEYNNLSPVFLPVKPENTSKTRSRQSQLSSKPKVVKTIISSTKETREKEKENGLPAIDRNVNHRKGSAVAMNSPRIRQIKGEIKQAYPAKCLGQEPKIDGSLRCKIKNNHVKEKGSSSSATSSRSTLTDQHEDKEEVHSNQMQIQKQNSRTEISNISLYINWLSEDDEESPKSTRVLREKPTKCFSQSQKVLNLSKDDQTSSKKALNQLLLQNKPNVVSQERAEALESLLELCAKLLKKEKLEELAGVLKPFGDEATSSRETAIWLTKGLINIHKEGATG